MSQAKLLKRFKPLMSEAKPSNSVKLEGFHIDKILTIQTEVNRSFSNQTLPS